MLCGNEIPGIDMDMSWKILEITQVDYLQINNIILLLLCTTCGLLQAKRINQCDLIQNLTNICQHFNIIIFFSEKTVYL